jgi:glycosidase
MRDLLWPEWAKNSNIYEVNIRQYTPEGTFKAFARHLPRLKEMEVDILWIMPIFPISITNRKGTLGSYYAPSTYRDVNPEFGTLDDFKEIIRLSHDLGMKVIIDWVPNHTGWDHEWIKKHPDYYLKDHQGRITEPVDHAGEPKGWSDVAQLDYRNPQMRQEMIKDMLFWVKEVGVDGFRQDMALLVPVDFWQEATAVLTYVKNDIFLVAESEHYEHLNKDCFHAFYGWSWHHILNQIAQGKDSVKSIRHWMASTRPNIRKGSYMLFTSNHDENSWSGSEIERMGLAYHAMAVLNYTMESLPLIYSGQEEPLPHRLDFFDKDNIDFRHYANQNFYKRLNQLKHQNSALWNERWSGETQEIKTNKDHMLILFRSNDHHQVYSIINLSNERTIIKSPIAVDGYDVFSQKHTVVSAGDDMYFGPWDYKIISSIKIG